MLFMDDFIISFLNPILEVVKPINLEVLVWLSLGIGFLITFYFFFTKYTAKLKLDLNIRESKNLIFISVSVYTGILITLLSLIGGGTFLFLCGAIYRMALASDISDYFAAILFSVGYMLSTISVAKRIVSRTLNDGNLFANSSDVFMSRLKGYFYFLGIALAGYIIAIISNFDKIIALCTFAAVLCAIYMVRNTLLTILIEVSEDLEMFNKFLKKRQY